MLKMSACVSAAFMAGLISVGCSGSGLKGGGGSAGAGGEVKGGQAGSTMSSGTAGGTGGAIGGSTTGGPIGATGGVADGSGGSIGVGGVGSGGTSGGTGGTISCLPALCSMPACAGDIQPNPDNPCGCPICVPNPDAGATKDAGSPDFPAYCELVDCGIERPCSSGYVRSTDLCGCPICAPVDAGIAKDTSQDSFVCSGPMPPCVPPPKTCPAGSQLVSPPCGCTGCMPVDGGTSDAGKPDTPVICYVMCPMIACTYGYLPNPEPCACSICAPPPDAGVPKNTQDAGMRTPLLHRAAGAACPTGRAPGPGPFTFSCNSVTCPAHLCVQDLNCTAGTNGRCLTGNPGGLALCSYDECFSDADCPANIPCECRDSASSSAPNSCLAGSDCRVDSDCGPGNFCSPSPAWVDAPYHCHTSSDTCMDDSDCMPLKSCAFDGQNGYWSCVVLPPPPT